MWFHGTPSTITNTGSVVELGCQDCNKTSTRQPGLYKVYSIKVKSMTGQDQIATVLMDPGSDTNYVTHDFAASLGLTGTPYSCFLKVVDMEYIKKSTARYS